MESLRVGDRITHEELGPGTVQALLARGRARIRFDAQSGLPRSLSRDELTLVEREGESQSAEPAADDRPAIVEEPSRDSRLARAEAWQTLEALRLGVVPAHGVQDYTVARDQELASLAELFEAERGCRVIWGDYGTGKTHLLDASEQLALERGFATARVTLDPDEIALHRPLRLYRKIMESVRFADSMGQGFEIVIDRLVESDEHIKPHGDRAQRSFSPYLHTLQWGDEEAIGWLRDYLRGDLIDTDEIWKRLVRFGWEGKRPLTMSDFRTYGRMYIHFVGTLASWCRDAGAKGLVLLFDEVERVDALTPTNRLLAVEVMKHYAAVTMKSGDLKFHPDELYRGGHSVHRALPLKFEEDQPLSLVLALTPLEEVQREFATITDAKHYDLHLGPLVAAAIPELVRRVAGIYGRAYPDVIASEETLDLIRRCIEDGIDDGHDSFRAAVRQAVFALDADRLRGRFE